MKRLFIGVPIQCKKAQGLVDRWQTDRLLNRNGLAWTKASNWHITLVFIGSCPEEAVDRLSALIHQAFDHTCAFTSALRGVGVFPDKRKPKVLWMGLDNLQPLLPAYQQLVDLLQRNDFAFDPKPLKPHLTLARVKQLADRSSLVGLLEQYRDTFVDPVFIDRITLFESVPTSQGVRYVPLNEKMLVAVK